MKPLFNIYLCLFASLCFIAACDDSDEEGISGFTINAQEFTLGADYSDADRNERKDYS